MKAEKKANTVIKTTTNRPAIANSLNPSLDLLRKLLSQRKISGIGKHSATSKDSLDIIQNPSLYTDANSTSIKLNDINHLRSKKVKKSRPTLPGFHDLFRKILCCKMEFTHSVEDKKQVFTIL